jgi:peptidoglycan/xylan/chitin deacetylase (PgdA/CDA1 family)
MASRMRRVAILVLLLLAGGRAASATKLTVGFSSNGELSIAVDPEFHSRFGLAYPVTYKLGIPPSASGLRVERRHTSSAPWETLPEKSSSDYFNGIEAVRFDYTHSIAYVSAAFDSTSDAILLRVVDATGTPVASTYEGMCKYYDNRKAAVVITLDDWKTYTLEPFRRAIPLMRSYGFPMTIAIITGGVEDDTTWREMQSEINVGDIEPASHTRTHPRWPDYTDVPGEVGGSKDDLLAHLTFPPLCRKGSQQYVYSWVAPYGETNSILETAVTNAGYLNDRLVGGSTGEFTAWSPTDQRYLSDGSTIEMGPPWGSTSQAELDGTFNAILAAGKIYTLLCHPLVWTEQSQWDLPYLTGHLSTISRHTDIWYTTFGHLYAYHLLPDSATGTVEIVDSPPTILAEPMDQSVAIGESAVFTAAASGSGILTYQWEKNRIPIAGAASASYATPAVTQADEGSAYRCIISNGAGTDTTAEAYLHIRPPEPPIITANPANHRVIVGQTAMFVVSISGTRPITCQWQKNGINIPGATDSSYVTPAAVLTDSGAAFRCIVSNNLGTDTSTPAYLSVVSAPSGIISDDFNTSSLNRAIWKYIDPTGNDTLSFVGTGSQSARLRLGIPSGSMHDAYVHGISAPRVIQDVPDIDFGIEAKFDGEMSTEYQMQGLMALADSTHFIRCDFVREEETLNFYSAIIENGTADVQVDIPVTLSPPFYVRLQRSGDTWKSSFSGNGVTWTTGATFTHTMSVRQLGLWSGNAGMALPGFAALIDYFFNMASPIVPEDGHTSTAPALVTMSPEDVTVWEEEAASYRAEASGTAPISYQWLKNGVAVTGATSTIYTIAHTALSDSGAVFRCAVHNAYGQDTSAAALLRVRKLVPASITAHPRGLTQIEGRPAMFSVAATGNAPLYYQWQKNGADISEAMDSMLVLPSVSSIDNGARFRAIVHNTAGTDTSREALLRTYAASPASVIPSTIVIIGSTSATDSAAIIPDSSWAQRYSRYMHEIYPGCTFVNLASRGTTTFNAMPTGFIPSSPYNTSAFIPDSSRNISHAVGLNPAIIIVSFPSTDCAASIPIATQVANYDTMLTHAAAQNIQIYFTTAEPRTASPAVRTMLTQLRDTTIARYGARAIDFWSGFADSSGNILSAFRANDSTLSNRGHGLLFDRIRSAVQMTIPTIRARIARGPDSITVSEGDSARFSVSTSGTAPLRYQWWRDTTAIPGAVDSLYAIRPVTRADSGARFWCVVSNEAGSDSSARALLHVTPLTKPRIVTQPRNELQIEGQRIVFTASGTAGTSPFSLSWQKNGVTISGAAESVLVVASPSLGDDSTFYRAIVTNFAGSDTSAAAILRVYPATPPAVIPSTVVILGSAPAPANDTLASDSGWIHQYELFVRSLYPSSVLHDLTSAYGSSFALMPDGHVPPDQYSAPARRVDTLRNITRAMRLGPAVLLVSVPAGDCISSIPVAQQIANFDTLFASAAAHGTQIYFATPTPRATSPVAFTLLRSLRDSLAARFGNRSVDFWTGLADSSGAILPAFRETDSTLNGAGQTLLCSRIRNGVRMVMPTIRARIASGPDSITVAERDSASFAVAVTGTAPIRYAWFRDTTLITGAIDSVYTLRHVTLSDSGAIFRCIISNAAGSDTSRFALLHVLQSPLPSFIVLHARAFLQGAISGDTMRTDLFHAGLIPKQHPYGNAPFGYTGTDSVSAVPDGVVDWILVELRIDSATSVANGKRVGFLKKDGTVTDLDGTSGLAFPGVQPGSYFVVLRHRNHLAGMSSLGTALDTNSTLYDFTTGTAKFFHTGGILSGSRAVFVAGDADATGDIGALDRTATWNGRNTRGYLSSDVDLTGDVGALDRSITWNSRNKACSVPEARTGGDTVARMTQKKLSKEAAK